jgi:hypothetical protein
MAAQTVNELTIEHLRSLPFGWLSASARVDFILLFASQKQTVRLKIQSAVGLEHLRLWCRQSGLDHASDESNFACVSSQAGCARGVLELDRSTQPHELELGLALDYPRCCCERIASIGEANIDSHAARVAQWPFKGPFTRINPSGYESGLALISHLPCSPECRASLAIAEKAREFIRTNESEPVLGSLVNSYLVAG